MSTTTQRLELSEAESFTFSFEVPSHTYVGDLAVSGRDFVRLADRVQVEGRVSSSDGRLEVGSDADLMALAAEGDITIGHRTQVFGTVESEGSVRAESSANVTGSIQEGTNLGADQLIEWEVSPGLDFATNVSLEPDQQRTLEPGAYRALSVKSRSVLTLKTGVYVFDSAQIEPQAKVLIDSSEGPVQIYVKNGFFFRGEVESTTAQDPELFIGYMGQDTIFVEAPYLGVVVAPEATVRFQSARPEGHIAAVHAKSVYLEPDIKLKKPAFSWVDVVDDGVVLPPLPTDPPHVMAESPGEVKLVGTGWQTGAPTGTSSWTVGTPLTFELKDEFEVDGGIIGNGSLTFSFTNAAGASHSCTYQGQAPSAEPQTKLDFALARLLKFVSCTDGLSWDASRTASSFSIDFSGVPNYPVSVGSPITKDGACSDKIELLTAAETAQMRENFSWDNATKVNETNEDGTPSLYYAWVYVRDEEELASYRKLLIHQLNRPLFDSELDEFAGKCGVLTNPGDGEGAFVLSVIPGKTYNRLISALTSDEVEGDRVIFDAVVLRDVPAEAQTTGGSISYQALAESGFEYLHYQSTNPLTQDGGVALDGGVAKALVGVLQFVGEVVVNIGEAILEGLGEFDELFRGDVDVDVWVHEINSDSHFDLTNHAAMIRAWGTHRGRPLAANDVQVTMLQRTFGTFIPSESKGFTDMDGKARLDVVKGRTRGNGLCVELKSEGAMVTGFLLASEVCDFRGFDENLSSTISDFRIGEIDGSRTDIPVRVDNERLAGLYQADDLHQWSDNVIGFSTKRARILSGYWADTFAPPNGDRKNLFAPCLNYGNTLSDAMLGASMTGGVFASALTGVPFVAEAAAVFGAVIGNTDIVMAENSAIEDSRNVMSHEYGHYLFCSLLQEEASSSVSHVIWSTISDGDDLSSPIRYLNEAMADFFTGQVAGGADYSWLEDSFGGDYCIDNGNACFDQNLSGSSSGVNDAANIGRIATMVHDLFDGRTEGFQAHVPGNADVWTSSNFGGPLALSSNQYGPKDGNLERLILRGSGLLNLGANLAQAMKDFDVKEGISDQAIYESLDDTMRDFGVTWCDRCRLLALHVPGDKGNVQELWDECQNNSMLSSVVGEAPVDFLRMSSFDDDELGVATCEACPEGYFSDENGKCTFCPNTVSGNTCEICPADVIVDGATVNVAGNEQYATSTSVAGDVCPEVFVMEVQNVSAIFDQPNVISFTSYATPSPYNESNCEQEYSLTSSWLAAGGSTEVQNGLGRWICDTDFCLDFCSDLPSTTVGRSNVEGDTVRLSSPSAGNTAVGLDFYLNSDIPR